MTLPKEAPMIEKCARAACDAAWTKHGEGWDHASDWQREEFRLGARAVLTALREPTPGMIAAAWDRIDAEKRATGVGRLGPGLGATDIWQAMLSSALNEGEGHG